ncbi:hypothetical protein MesoLj131c_45540 [Mesorhizobium sp. 131-3-5]|uniref:hypothetical protein n=1 Tax=Mesorhizobium sp. 131-3-5 TaxID=2744520 RepID=UPI0019281082|nr:hypothetical protein [Mesorhizobium sp. 131-3-5]BCH10296.1 hypothetical protein MesoLj131c_45540 [Mesorhizobium sp. 131-3-5]
MGIDSGVETWRIYAAYLLIFLAVLWLIGWGLIGMKSQNQNPWWLALFWLFGAAFLFFGDKI